MKRLFSIVVICCFLYSCDHREDEIVKAPDLMVSNHSKEYIFEASVLSGEMVIDFGVIGVGAGKSMGFGFMSSSSKLGIRWNIKGEKPILKSWFDTKSFSTSYDGIITRYEFRYKGDRKWDLLVYGPKAEGKHTGEVVGTINGSVPKEK